MGKATKSIVIIILIACAAFLGCASKSTSPQMKLRLWYTQPAKQWKESLPIGNGSLGTMVQGRIFNDTLVINEETIWSGGPHDYTNPRAFNHLEKLRALIKADKYEEAIVYGDKHMLGLPKSQQMFQPLGQFIFKMEEQGEVTNYKRSLNLNEAIAEVSFDIDGFSYKREYFASFPGKAILIRLSTNAKEGLKMKLKHTSNLRGQTSNNRQRYYLEGISDDAKGVDGKVRYTAAVQIAEGYDNCCINKDGISINGAKEVVLHYVASSNYVGYNDLTADSKRICNNRLDELAGKNFKQLKKQHIKDYSELFNRVSVNFGVKEIPQYPTDKLIVSARNGNCEPYLDVLFYQMARYLTIAGSRTGSQPLNLQGIWNDNPNPPWDCKWTLNINLPMNYWMTEGANLSECHNPVFELIKDLHKTGAKVAKEHYNCRGFVVHHNTDLWRGAAPVDGSKWGLWTFGGAWLTRHLWEHYQYTLDKDFLKEYYPIMKDASLFFFDFLTEDDEGYLVTTPTVSFEQSYEKPNGETGRLTAGPTMDNQILRDLFSNCLTAAKIVGDDSFYQDSLILISNRLRPTKISERNNRLMEWSFEADPKPYCGQLAPLWGVNPGTEINPVATPDIAEAAKRTIKYRTERMVDYEKSGSWVTGTKTNFLARLYEGDEAYASYHKMVKENLFPNVLASFYPQKYFMIDGNLGTANAFQEMLVQSHRKNNDEIIVDLLPALPSAWPNGKIKGIKIRGGATLYLNWKNGKLEDFELLNPYKTKYRLLVNGTEVLE